MKKIAYILPVFGLSLMLAACDFNELNFPGYDDEVAPTNVFAYEDSVTETDMADISKLGLKAATNTADSTAAKYLATNKYFHDIDAPASKYIPLWLATKYKYGDPKSYVLVTTPQYIAEEGEVQYITEKYILDSAYVFNIYNNEIYAETFMTSLGDFTALSVTGDQKWYWSSYSGVGFAKISGYSSGNKDNEDWLISPAIDLSKRTDAVLLFDNTHKYGTVYTKEMTVWVTDNWDGTTLDTLQWVKKEFNRATGADYTFIAGGPIYLTEYAGKSGIRVAFRYLSNTAESCPTWEINNFQVLETLEE
jgi:hypothetical protein